MKKVMITALALATIIGMASTVAMAEDTGTGPEGLVIPASPVGNAEATPKADAMTAPLHDTVRPATEAAMPRDVAMPRQESDAMAPATDQSFLSYASLKVKRFAADIYERVSSLFASSDITEEPKPAAAMIEKAAPQ